MRNDSRDDFKGRRRRRSLNYVCPKSLGNARRCHGRFGINSSLLRSGTRRCFKALGAGGESAEGKPPGRRSKEIFGITSAVSDRRFVRRLYVSHWQATKPTARASASGVNSFPTKRIIKINEKIGSFNILTAFAPFCIYSKSIKTRPVQGYLRWQFRSDLFRGSEDQIPG